ncbi:MAG: DUF4923 family protein [Bacteroidales bacterium]|nr:DUF4923 family protein [Bacteroidales bacterium]MBR3065947.1 DUF4923 family protein [Bacteroidales bacterium]
MKRFTLIAAAILMVTVSANAQGLGGLLGKLTGSGDTNAGSIVSSITDLLSGKSALSPETIAGNWNYTGSAISFKSDNNPLSNIASTAAQSTIEKKLDGYLQKVGISQGLFGFTFNEDGTMAIKYGSKSFPGTWTLDQQNATLNMKVASLINMKGYVAVKNGKMELLFDATTMMKIIKSLTSVYKNSTLQTINSVLNQYDKMYAGFNLTK